jgi:hypothetical protein
VDVFDDATVGHIDLQEFAAKRIVLEGLLIVSILSPQS